MNRLSALLILLFVFGCSSDSEVVYETDVERIISTLASDDMQGRSPYTEDGWNAARFIASEFEEIGLSTFARDDDFIQDIPLVTRSTSGLRVSVNGEAISDEHVAGSISAESGSWTETDDMNVVMVGPQNELLAAWRAHRRSGNTLIVVHPEHAEDFDRFGSFTSRPSRSMTTGSGSGANMVMVLSDVSKVTSFSVEGSAVSEETPIANVVGVIEGKRSDEYVLFSAHYDHLGVRDVEGDAIYNGANDNASGTTAVIQLARHFKSGDQPERTLLFVGFTAEESGGYGSRFFSEQLDPEQIVAMFNIEMIGKPAVEGPNTAWITGFGRSDFGTILQEAVEGTIFEFYPDPYPDQNLFYRSDNATLARLGVPAHSISTTPIDVDPDYHQASDEVSTLDLDHLANTIDAIAAGAASIVSGETTPTRVDPVTVN